MKEGRKNQYDVRRTTITRTTGRKPHMDSAMGLPLGKGVFSRSNTQEALERELQETWDLILDGLPIPEARGASAREGESRL